jgi:mannose-6-phosphate isomerase
LQRRQRRQAGSLDAAGCREDSADRTGRKTAPVEAQEKRMEALKLTPACKEYLWGGRRLKTAYGKKGGAIIAESWELSCNPGGLSMIAGTDLSLRDWLTMHREAMGPEAAPEFPLLVKLIDAQKPLSIQVHPGDRYARSHEGCQGKTEMWYILDHEPGAFIYLGFRRDVTKPEIRLAVENGRLETLLKKLTVRRGDVFFIPAGVVHGIGGGILLAEVQQNSDITYRLYDFGRLDQDGKPRALHLEQALEVLSTRARRWVDVTRKIVLSTEGYRLALVGRHTAFSVFELDVARKSRLPLIPASFTYLLVLEGEGSIGMDGRRYRLHKGEGLFLPAGEKCYTIDTPCVCLLVTPGDPQKFWSDLI